jgi:predicted AlkP superfamily pyrophosphatase or phosphodiesterase
VTIPTRRAVIVVCDSLRADLIRPNTAPTLAALGASSTNYTGCTGVFPSVTRVTSASVATGCHPGRHGLLGNTMVLDEGAGLVCLSVAKPEFRERMRKATGRTLLVPTLAERLAGHGGSIVMSNVSAGAAYFQDPDGFGHVYHSAGSFGPGLVPLPAAEQLDIEKGEAGDATMTARFCHEVLRERRPSLGVLWLSEPDNTGHKSPLGSPAHLSALRAADACVKRVLDTLEELGGDALLLVCSDHGMETTARTIPVDDLLVEAGLKAGQNSNDLVTAPNGTATLIYRARDAKASVNELRRFLESQDWVDRIFTGEQLAEVSIPTDGPVAAAVSLRTENRPNEFGIWGYGDIAADLEGRDFTGFGQHGGLGPNEQRPFLFVRGPGYWDGATVETPVSHVSIAPTVLEHLGLPWDGMDGQPLPAAR